MGQSLSRRRWLSLAIIAGALAIAIAPWSPWRRTLRVAIGSELEQPMRELEASFERRHPHINLIWQVQGSQDMVNQALEPSQKRPRVLIPASQELLKSLQLRLRRQQAQTSLHAIKPVASTVLVAVSWPERAAVLFGQGSFRWSSLSKALKRKWWKDLGGEPSWGRFNLRTSDPLRSNSGQLALLLWLRSQGTDAAIQTWRGALYLPPRSTDIMLREFIATGPNDGDIAFAYECDALYRAEESRTRHGSRYRVLYPDPTYETVLTAAVLKGPAEGSLSDGERLLRFLRAADQQQLLRNWGFRSVDGQLPEDAETDAGLVEVLPPPDQQLRDQALRLWQQAS